MLYSVSTFAPCVGEIIEDAQLVWYPTTFAFDWCGEHKTRP